VHYIEAFVRSGSTNQDWDKSTIPHRTTLIDKAEDGSWLHLLSELPFEPKSDPPVKIEHNVSAGEDEVTFLVTATNLGTEFVDVLWAEPCIRVGNLTGFGEPWPPEEDYIYLCFIFLDGKLTTLDETPRSWEGYYYPGQVYAPVEKNRDNLNPRPISTAIPSNGLIGAYSTDKRMMVATAWQPYQELFQGIVTCIHSDFRIGGLEPGETKTIRGKIYIMESNIEELLQQYNDDFGE
jgi:hypothetical protein